VSHEVEEILDFGLEEALTIDGSGTVINRLASSIQNPQSKIRNPNGSLAEA
jgi:hypothetical protein